MSTPKKSLSSNTTPSGPSSRRQPNNPTTSSSTPRGPSPSTVLSTSGVVRTASIKTSSGANRPARPSTRRPGSVVGNTSMANTTNEDNAKEEEARMENAALIENLKKNLRDAEILSDDYQRQLTAVQREADDLSSEHAKLEERFHESAEKIEELECEKKESLRHVREMENIYESERMAMLKDREDSSIRETDLRTTIQRLKEAMSGREARISSMNGEPEKRSPRLGRSPARSDDDSAQFAPPSSLQRSDSKSTSRLVMQKDQIIEELRLELAEAQIKLVEMENMGGHRLQDLEKTLLETRMTNARLMEDNESFQLLLGEKTLNGDFRKAEFMQSSTSVTSGLGSLAEELESAEGESENYRRVEAEARSLRDQNKALTLYIEKIISRVLQHENFETILDTKTEGLGAALGSMQKDLPPPPPDKDDAAQPSVLQRAVSVARRQRPVSQMFTSMPLPPDESNITRRPRPQSQILAPAPDRVPTANENPATAPSIPLGRAQSVSNRQRGHRRTVSEKSDEIANPGVAAVVNQMYKGPPASTPGGPLSPLSPGGSAARSAYFGAPSPLHGGVGGTSSPVRPRSGSRGVSGLRPSSSGLHGPKSSSGSTVSGGSSSDLPSPPRNSAGNTTYTGAVMTQNKLRPLRLVQENDEEAAKKKANRGSWIGWFNRSKEEGAIFGGAVGE